MRRRTSGQLAVPCMRLPFNDAFSGIADDLLTEPTVSILQWEFKKIEMIFKIPRTHTLSLLQHKNKIYFRKTT